MRYHLIVSDGGFASGLAEALGMLLGKWEDVLRVSFQDGMALPTFQEQVRQVTALITAEDDPLDETAEAMKACAVEKIEQLRTDAGSEDDI
ncbi:hypothetical protein [uncultured Oscillibacter sp.]|uniref:hypothetical protein n=1 Tax=uncultured Oscillibacter sp. TaxID=876091 RepID=UPI0026098716|nr:hypothetical protein [uncultured Oscillibacter sp.]